MGSILEMLVFYITLKYTLKILDKVISIITLGSNKQKDISRFKNNIVNIGDLYSLTPHEFEEWCGSFLAKCGYSDITVSPIGADGGKDIVCKTSSETAYVECKRYSPNLYAPIKVDVDTVKKLLGSMVHDNVHTGIIITTGRVSRQASDFILSLPKTLNIEVIDGDILVGKCRKYKLYSAVQV